MSKHYWIGIDIGGTFTDIVLINKESGEITVYKHPSSTQSPDEGAVEGIRKILLEENISEYQIEKVVHGTTVATNSIIENKGAKTAMLITRGFRDILEIRRQNRPHLYNFRMSKPEPLIPRELIFEVNERMQSNGEILTEISTKELESARRWIMEKEIESIAVCFLHSYRNGLHERLVKEYLEKNLPKLSISLSHEVLSEFKEYERASTTAANASVTPVVKRYLDRMNKNLAKLGIEKDVLVMQSNGGVISSEQAGNHAVQTLISGPAAGVLAGMSLSGTRNFITADMGGTSFDVSLVTNGKPRFTMDGEVAGYDLRLPRVDVNTIGAGGGSIAWTDKGGALRVGPKSSGSFPGPAGYSRGGKQPTVTDAHIVLGRLNPDYLLGGAMKIDKEAAERVIRENIAQPLGLSLREAAQGIVDVVNAEMVKGIRKVSVERGIDPSEYDLISFGGAGPLHAVELARELNIGKVIIPYYPGVNSAIGLLQADYQFMKIRSLLVIFDETSLSRINSSFSELLSDIRRDLSNEGFSGEALSFDFTLYLRYSGQGSELGLIIEEKEINQRTLEELFTRFTNEHRREYGYIRENEKIELVSIRLTVVVEACVENFRVNNSYSKDYAVQCRREVFLDGKKYTIPVYLRNQIDPRQSLEGPCIIEQFDSTTVIPADSNVSIDDQLNLIISKI